MQVYSSHCECVTTVQVTMLHASCHDYGQTALKMTLTLLSGQRSFTWSKGAIRSLNLLSPFGTNGFQGTIRRFSSNSKEF